ncbi:proline dehydrogenase [Chengkuizengella axinellae]|uniref:proline dehydrogenase n=1 Tax=Chengkuizengella axinellae TaxID=3064388 RepID=A0ABT9IY39_9BACL|nr:proline dehydrogenase [Chengkuizengella sp. 2205SS18-9]MDP5274282.1 proline dehydrogenase [Chengkuizengella sp. 2205SS18-9]
MEALSRNFFLYLSKNKSLNKMAKRYGLKFGASKVVGGIDFDRTVSVIKNLNNRGLCTTVDHLGEFVNSVDETRERTAQEIHTIQTIAKEKLDAQTSVKLTSLGLDIDHHLVFENMRNILTEAQKHGVFVTIDMEDEVRCQGTLDIFKGLKTEFDNVGTVIQSYLYRSRDDINDLKKLLPNLRLVKGAYKESADVAYPDKKDVDDNLKQMIKDHLTNGNYTAVASHDDQIINFTKQFAEENNISRDLFEFQMLYGMRTQTQLDLVKQGYKMRVYVPYGNDWYGYFMRRLAERPANVAFVAKGMFRS